MSEKVDAYLRDTMALVNELQRLILKYKVWKPENYADGLAFMEEHRAACKASPFDFEAANQEATRSSTQTALDTLHGAFERFIIQSSPGSMDKPFMAAQGAFINAHRSAERLAMGEPKTPPPPPAPVPGYLDLIVDEKSMTVCRKGNLYPRPVQLTKATFAVFMVLYRSGDRQATKDEIERAYPGDAGGIGMATTALRDLLADIDIVIPRGERILRPKVGS